MASRPDFPYPYDVKSLPLFPPIEAERFPAPSWPLQAGFGAMLFGFLAMNFSLLPVAVFAGRPSTLGGVLVIACMGGIGAQAGLLAIFAVWGPGQTTVRHLVTSLIAGGLIIAWLAGAYFATSIRGNNYSPDPAEMAPILLMLPLVFLACELPLWGFRILLRWRIEPPAAEKNVPAVPQLSIAGILQATAAVALALASGRLGVSLLAEPAQADSWPGMGISLLITAVLSLGLLPMTVRLLFRSRSAVIGAVFAAAWVCLLPGSVIFLVSVIMNDWRPDVWVPMTSTIISFCLGLVGSLLLIRHAGYRLLWGREADRESTKEGTS